MFHYNHVYLLFPDSWYLENVFCIAFKINFIFLCLIELEAGFIIVPFYLHFYRLFVSSYHNIFGLYIDRPSPSSKSDAPTPETLLT
jgi:hypothetical protein